MSYSDRVFDCLLWSFDCSDLFSERIPTYSVALPSMAVQLYMLGLGFYTVFKFWRESGADDRRRMRILWLVLFTFTWDFISALFLLMFSGTSAEILLFREAFQFFNKVYTVLSSNILILLYSRCPYFFRSWCIWKFENAQASLAPDRITNSKNKIDAQERFTNDTR